MATVLKTPPLRAPLPPRLMYTKNFSLKSPNPFRLPIRYKSISTTATTTKLTSTNSLQLAAKSSLRFVKLVPFASEGETETTQTEETVQEPEIQDSSDGAVEVEDGAGEVEGGVGEVEEITSGEEVADVEETTSSIILTSLRSYREALASNDEARIAEIEAFLKSVEDEKNDLGRKVASLIEELSTEKDRVLRISADFDNFRKRTDRERLSLVSNAQGEVVENLLPVLDNFERAKAQIKLETEGEEKINNSYQSIYKQFVEILGSLGVVPVETIGNPFDPLLHEAIMREDSTEFEEGIILQEFRKGFKLGDRLLRPSMVKVSAGPGPAKPEQAESSAEVETAGETSQEGSPEPESAS
ncbi:protein GrpE isoform X1 [Ricinus communis]|uniref:protein GrpE isoform X1 n=1 Tax=Ricinus communis TaxID=3988 RepID=UPI00201A3B68|nr:protein GrpE isoform X1 [Ricinus communis]